MVKGSSGSIVLRLRILPDLIGAFVVGVQVAGVLCCQQKQKED